MNLDLLKRISAEIFTTNTAENSAPNITPRTAQDSIESPTQKATTPHCHSRASGNLIESTAQKATTTQDSIESICNSPQFMRDSSPHLYSANPTHKKNTKKYSTSIFH